MQKITRYLCSGLLFLTAAACNTDTGEAGSAAVQPQNPFHGQKILVAYYSHSGNTQAVARQIAQITGADLFALETVQTYPSAYNQLTAQAQQEINAGFMPELKNKVSGWEQYDLIFIGSPNWWGTYAPAVKTFLAQYDFSGKRLVPFFTHGGGGMQHCESDMHQQLPTASFLPAATFPGRSSGAKPADLQNWLEKAAAETL